MADPEIRVVTVPMHDTGIGREAGFENDAALIAHAQAERAKADALLTPEAAADFRAADAEIERLFLFGA